MITTRSCYVGLVTLILLVDPAFAQQEPDDIIDNSGPIAALGPQVRALDRRYRELAALRG